MSAGPNSRISTPKHVKFAFGGCSGMAATVFVQPLDLLKNRMQLSGEGGRQRQYRSTFHALSTILRSEGVTGLYTGLSAGLLRQATYTTTRLGIYSTLFDKFSAADGTPPNFLTKAVIGMTAGCIGAFVGTPAEVSLIRMTSDGRLPPAERRGYTNAFNAISRIVKEEGLLVLCRGCGPTVIRAMVGNVAQLTSYSQAKQGLKSTGYFYEGISLHFCASMVSGLISTIVTMPVDISKTRLQTMKTVNGKGEYKGALDVLSKTIRKEGFFSLWKGFVPYYARLGPHTVLTFMFLEQLNRLYKQHIMGVNCSGGGL